MKESHRQIYNIRYTKSDNLNVFRLVLQLSLPNPTGGERTRVSADTLVKMADNIFAHRTGLLWLSEFASIFI